MDITEELKESVWQAFQLEMKSSDTFTLDNWNNICAFAPAISTIYSEITGLTKGQIRALIHQYGGLKHIEKTIFGMIPLKLVITGGNVS